MKKLTLKEYLQAQPRHARIPEYLMTCGPLLDLLNERDELREQLEAVAKAEPLLDEEGKIVTWLEPTGLPFLEPEQGVSTSIYGGEVFERPV